MAEARRELVRIGIDRLAAAAIGSPEELAAGAPSGLLPGQRLRRPGRGHGRRPVQVLDARRDDERAAGGVRSSLHIPIHELAGRIDEVPEGEVWVYCGSGYRASIAASCWPEPAGPPSSWTATTTTASTVPPPSTCTRSVAPDPLTPSREETPRCAEL